MHVVRIVKKNALLALKTHWGSALGILFLTACAVMLITLADALASFFLGITAFQDVAGTPANYLDDLFNLSLPSLILSVSVFAVSFLALIPLGMGYIRWYFRLAEGNPQESHRVLYYFTSLRLYFRSLALGLQVGVRAVILPFLCIAPGVGLIVLGQALGGSIDGNSFGIIAVICMVVGALLTGAGAIASVILLLRYFLVPFLAAEDDGTNVWECVRKSVAHMRGNTGTICLLAAEMIPWLLLCVLVIPALYVVPYVSESFAIASKYIIEKSRRK